MNHRRKLVFALASGALPALPGSFAQQPTRALRVGVLVLGSKATAEGPESIGALATGLRELGHVEGRTLLLEWRFADGDAKRLPQLAAELVNWKPDVLVGAASNPAAALLKATSTIPMNRPGYCGGPLV